MYQIKTEQFSGPLDVLLNLVEKRNLEITEISLSEVTQDYLGYINNNDSISPYNLAEFLVIASTLLLIKSKAILPSLILEPEEKEEIADLEQHLRWYKFFKDRGKDLQLIFQNGAYCFNRLPWKGEIISFNVPKNVTSNYLAQQFQNVIQKDDREIEPQTKVVRKIANLQERIHLLLNKLTKGTNYQFSQLVQGDDKDDMIVTFLAILHLLRRQIIKVSQKETFGEIWISNQK